MNRPATLTHWRTDHGMIATDKPLRKRPADDFYPTPYELCRAVLERFAYQGPNVLDPGCGDGVWGRAARDLWPNNRIVGIESNADRITASRAAGCLDAYDLVLWADFLKARLPMGFDAVIGNPPYQLAEEFVMRSLELLKPGGVVIFLLRLAFLESQGRYDRMFSNAARPSVIYSLVERPSFTGNGKTDATAYAVFAWHHEYLMRQKNPPTSLYWLSWRRDTAPATPQGQLVLPL